MEVDLKTSPLSESSHAIQLVRPNSASMRVTKLVQISNHSDWDLTRKPNIRRDKSSIIVRRKRWPKWVAKEKGPLKSV